MRTQKIGISDLKSTRLAYGCWRLAGSEGGPKLDTSDARKAVLAAFDAGYTFFDHADIYGRSECETRFGAVLKENPTLRGQITLATKCGIRPPWDGAQHCYDSSAAHITASVEASLQRLGVEEVDLLMIHRPDYLGDPAEIVETFNKLRDAGKVRWFGVSNFRPAQLTALQRASNLPLVVQQVEVSLGALFTLDDGTIDQCLADHITPLAWSPLARGGIFKPESPVYALLETLAAKYHTTPTALALAWLLRHPAKMIPIIGSTNPARIREAADADRIELSREDWYALLIAARGAKLP